MSRPIGLAPLALVLGCFPEYPGPLAVLDRVDEGDAAGGYAVRAVEIPGFDAAHVDGPIGRALRGGALDTSGYTEGARMTVRATEADGVWVPVDEDGLVIWSFYHQLAAADAELAAEAGADLAPLWPVTLAWNPVSIYDFAAAENAAYASGARMFLVMPDALPGVPLAANAGVVRHELAHAWFEILLTGSADGPDPTLDAPLWQIQATRALNEGWADAVAALSLDDPAFLDDSLDIPDRLVGRPDAVAEPSSYPDPGLTAVDVLVGAYDPYALGTVYASFAWDLYGISGDRWETLRVASDAVAAWGAAEDWGNPDGWVLEVLARVPPRQLDAACAAAAVRFPDLETGCS